MHVSAGRGNSNPSGALFVFLTSSFSVARSSGRPAAAKHPGATHLALWPARVRSSPRTQERAPCPRVLDLYPARPGPLRLLVASQPSNGSIDTVHHIFHGEAAEHLGPPSDTSEAERIEWIPLADIRRLVAKGEIVRGKRAVASCGRVRTVCGTLRAAVQSSWPGSAAQLAGWLSLIWATKVLTAGKARSGRSRKMA